jgi:hypothetical protein
MSTRKHLKGSDDDGWKISHKPTNGLRVVLGGGGRKLDDTRAQRRHGKPARRWLAFIPGIEARAFKRKCRPRGRGPRGQSAIETYDKKLTFSLRSHFSSILSRKLTKRRKLKYRFFDALKSETSLTATNLPKLPSLEVYASTPPNSALT